VSIKVAHTLNKFISWNNIIFFSDLTELPSKEYGFIDRLNWKYATIKVVRVWGG